MRKVLRESAIVALIFVVFIEGCVYYQQYLVVNFHQRINFFELVQIFYRILTWYPIPFFPEIIPFISESTSFIVWGGIAVFIKLWLIFICAFSITHAIRNKIAKNIQSS